MCCRFVTSSEHSLRREPGNEVDKNAVAVVQETQSGTTRNTTRASSQAEPLNTHPNEVAVGMEVVVHVPKLMAQWVTKFLKRASNSVRERLFYRKADKQKSRIWFGIALRV